LIYSNPSTLNPKELAKPSFPLNEKNLQKNSQGPNLLRISIILASWKIPSNCKRRAGFARRWATKNLLEATFKTPNKY